VQKVAGPNPARPTTQLYVLVSGTLMLGIFFGWKAFKTKLLFWASSVHILSEDISTKLEFYLNVGKPNRI
jgi:hypothetical protein